MKKETKIPRYLKFGIIFVIITLIFEILYASLGSILTTNFQFIGIVLLNIQKIVFLPLFILGAISSQVILLFVYYFSPDYLYPALPGNILTLIFWFAIGALIGKVYKRKKKR